MDFNKILGQLGVLVLGVQNYMVGDNFANVNGGHCCTFGEISDETLQLGIIGGFLVLILMGVIAPVSTLW